MEGLVYLAFLVLRSPYAASLATKSHVMAVVVAAMVVAMVVAVVVTVACF